MPKLSKFRVVNLIYNDTRHIYDEVFDFNDGIHTMMLLANGGGKTVLTQMMMQPVIPKTDLKTRKFADYFKNNRRPTLLMSEWQLDDDAGQLLSGLVIKNRVRKKRGADEALRALISMHSPSIIIIVKHTRLIHCRRHIKMQADAGRCLILMPLSLI